MMQALYQALQTSVSFWESVFEIQFVKKFKSVKRLESVGLAMASSLPPDLQYHYTLQVVDASVKSLK